MVIKCKRYEQLNPDLPDSGWQTVKCIFHMSDVMNVEDSTDDDWPGTVIYFYNGWQRTITVGFDTFSKWYDEYHSKPRYNITLN